MKLNTKINNAELYSQIRGCHILPLVIFLDDNFTKLPGRIAGTDYIIDYANSDGEIVAAEIIKCNGENATIFWLKNSRGQIINMLSEAVDDTNP